MERVRVTQGRLQRRRYPYTYCLACLPRQVESHPDTRRNHALTSSHNGSPYVHATGITSFNTSISQIHNYSISMTLISPSPYLKTIIKHPNFLSIQHTQKKVSQILNTKHFIIKQITMLLRDSQNNLSEA